MATSSIVVDASVAAKWFLPGDDEPFRDQAIGLLNGFATGLIGLSVPDLFWAEMGYLLRKAARRQRIDQGRVHEALHELEGLDLATVATRHLIKNAALIAEASDISTYDAIYVALAIASGHILITADERVASKTAARCPVQMLQSMNVPAW